jgi:hypothetical protein
MKNQDENNTHEKKKGDQTSSSFDADCRGSFTLNLPYLLHLQCCWLLGLH